MPSYQAGIGSGITPRLLVWLHIIEVFPRAGAGLSNVPHMFYYPEEAAKQYTVNKFDDAEKGGQGLAEMVKGVADESIKARTRLPDSIDGNS